MKQKDFYNQDIHQIIDQFQTNEKHGLSENQYKINKEVYDKNTLFEAKKQSGFMKFVKQFLESTTLILIIAGIVSIFLGEYDNLIAITVLLLVNGVIGFI